MDGLSTGPPQAAPEPEDPEGRDRAEAADRDPPDRDPPDREPPDRADPAPPDSVAGPTRGSRRHAARRGRRVLGAVVGLAVGLGALGALALGSTAVARRTSALQSPAQIRADTLDARYYDCLATQAHSLVRPGQGVNLYDNGLGDFVTLAKTVAGWTTLTANPHDVQLVLRPVTTGGCRGSAVVALVPGPAGTPPTVRVGRGASLPGPPPPAV